MHYVIELRIQKMNQYPQNRFGQILTDESLNDAVNKEFPYDGANRKGQPGQQIKK
ncbi:hypothetical protein D3C76_1872830 [compost metagenome]|nr:hypothetical protein J25TS5_31660 [Paenibacillus faecis]